MVICKLIADTSGASRAHNRTLKDKPRSKEEMDDIYHNDTTLWRKRILAYAVTGEKQAARTNAMSGHEEKYAQNEKEQTGISRKHILLNIPWGYFMLPLYMKPKTSDRECRYMWSMPVFAKEVACQVDKMVLQAVATFNLAQREKETKPMWRRRCQIFTMVCKDLDVSTTQVPDEKESAAVVTSSN